MALPALAMKSSGVHGLKLQSQEIVEVRFATTCGQRSRSTPALPFVRAKVRLCHGSLRER